MNRLGNTSIQISPIVMGLWQAGADLWLNVDDRNTLAAIQASLDNGVNTFDTARVYGDGHSEKILGQALQGKREDAVVCSKVIMNLDYDAVMEACNESLRCLKMDYIDLYYIHWPSGQFGEEIIPIEETMRALTDLKQQGKIKAIGVSNFSLEQLQEAEQYGRIDAVQPPYSLIWRKEEDQLIPYCQTKNITIFSYSSLAGGLLTGKFKENHRFPKNELRNCINLSTPAHLKRINQLLEELEPIANKYDTTIANIALAWIIYQPGLNAIVGARTKEQAECNARAMHVNLSEHDFDQISKLSHVVTDHVKLDSFWNIPALLKLREA